LDIDKRPLSLALAESRALGEIANDPDAIRKLCERVKPEFPPG